MKSDIHAIAAFLWINFITAVLLACFQAPALWMLFTILVANTIISVAVGGTLAEPSLKQEATKQAGIEDK